MATTVNENNGKIDVAGRNDTQIKSIPAIIRRENKNSLSYETITTQIS